MDRWTKVKYKMDHEGYRPKHVEGWGYCDACNLPTCLRRFYGPNAENPFYDYLRKSDKAYWLKRDCGNWVASKIEESDK